MILIGFDEAKQSIKQVGSKNTQVKSLLDQMEKDLNTLRNKSRRQMIQTSINQQTPNTSSVNAMDSINTFNLQLLQSGQTFQHFSGGAEYPSINSHGAYSSLMPNQMPAQFTEEESEIILQKDRIYRKVSDLFALLKQGEDEAQVQMLNWENFII